MKQLIAPCLITREHDVSCFDSGEASLDEWLKRRALRNEASGTSRCFVMCHGKKVVGYYCLSAGSIMRGEAPKAMQRNMPDILPISLIGRLAIDKTFQNHGLGSALLRDAMLRVVNVASEIGIFAILVHALSDQAKRFYISRGFIESPIQPMTLFMTVDTIRSVLASNC